MSLYESYETTVKCDLNSMLGKSSLFKEMHNNLNQECMSGINCLISFSDTAFAALVIHFNSI